MIYRMAGRLGIDPAPLSIRELFWMFDGRYESQDAGLRSIIAAIINTVSTKPVKPSDLVHEKTGNDEEEVMTEDQALMLFLSMGLVQ